MKEFLIVVNLHIFTPHAHEEYLLVNLKTRSTLAPSDCVILPMDTVNEELKLRGHGGVLALAELHGKPLTKGEFNNHAIVAKPNASFFDLHDFVVIHKPTALASGVKFDTSHDGGFSLGSYARLNGAHLSAIA